LSENVFNDLVIGFQILIVTNYTFQHCVHCVHISLFKPESIYGLEIWFLFFALLLFSCFRTLIKTVHSSKNVTFICLPKAVTFHDTTSCQVIQIMKCDLLSLIFKDQ